MLVHSFFFGLPLPLFSISIFPPDYFVYPQITFHLYIVFVMDKQCFGWVCLSIIGICGTFSPNSANANWKRRTDSGREREMAIEKEISNIVLENDHNRWLADTHTHCMYRMYPGPGHLNHCC